MKLHYQNTFDIKKMYGFSHTMKGIIFGVGNRHSSLSCSKYGKI